MPSIPRRSSGKVRQPERFAYFGILRISWGGKGRNRAGGATTESDFRPPKGGRNHNRLDGELRQAYATLLPGGPSDISSPPCRSQCRIGFQPVSCRYRARLSDKISSLLLRHRPRRWTAKSHSLPACVGAIKRTNGATAQCRIGFQPVTGRYRASVRTNQQPALEASLKTLESKVA